jgi:hypothetical protein
MRYYGIETMELPDYMPCANSTLSIQFRDNTRTISSILSAWFSKNQFYSDRLRRTLGDLARAFNAVLMEAQKQ